MNTQKNHTLELIKLFAAYMVVFIHVSFYGELGVVVDGLSRFAVPFFFLVSGYYSYRINAEKIKKRIVKILTLFIFSAICCAAFEIIVLLKYNTAELSIILNKFAELCTYVNLFVFNLPVISGHLWYLLAILYVYVIFYFVTKFHIKERVIFIVSLFLLVAHIVLGEGLSLFGITLPIPYVRNFALMGIPFFSLGLFVKKYENRFKKLPNYMVFAFSLIGVVETVFSRCFFGSNEFFIGSLFILIALVCVFIKCADIKYPAFLTSLEGCSTYIYVFHLIITKALLIIYGMVGIDIYSSVTLENLHPIVVCVAATVFAYVVNKALKFKKLKK